MHQQGGDEMIKKLILNKDHPIFNEFEKRFIRDLMKLHIRNLYADLSKRDKACIQRCIGWLEGNDCE